MISEANKTILIHRSKSFIWRLGGVAVVAIIDFTAENLGLFDISPQMVAFFGLVLGEITKYINTNLPKK